MTGSLSIFKREVHAFFVMPIAYVVLTTWLLYFGQTFSTLAKYMAAGPDGSNVMSALFGGTTLFYMPLLVFAPVLTMRLLAEEKASGTIEALLTAPVTEWAIVVGKFAAAMVYWCTLWTPTLLYFWLVTDYGPDAIDAGATASTYMGLFCMGLPYMSIGLLMSAVTRSQIVAALLTFLVLGTFFLVGLQAFGIQDDVARAVFEYVSVWTQMATFSKGIVDTRFVVFDVSVALLAVFITVFVLRSQRVNG